MAACNCNFPTQPPSPPVSTLCRNDHFQFTNCLFFENQIARVPRTWPGVASGKPWVAVTGYESWTRTRHEEEEAVNAFYVRPVKMGGRRQGQGQGENVLRPAEGFSITFINFPKPKWRSPRKWIAGHESFSFSGETHEKINRRTNPIPSLWILLTSFRPNCIAVYLKATPPAPQRTIPFYLWCDISTLIRRHERQKDPRQIYWRHQHFFLYTKRKIIKL